MSEDETQPKKIKVTVDRSPEIEALQKELKEERDKQKKVADELEELKATQAQKALDTFEEQKTALIEAAKDLPEPQRKQIEENLTPENIGVVKGLIAGIISATEEPVKGKASITGQGSGEGFDPTSDKLAEQKKFVNDLYFKAYKDPSATQAEKAKALAQINKLWNSASKGEVFKKLRQLKQEGKPTVLEGVSCSCPDCGMLTEAVKGDKDVTCSNCGRKFSID